MAQNVCCSISGSQGLETNGALGVSPWECRTELDPTRHLPRTHPRNDPGNPRQPLTRATSSTEVHTWHMHGATGLSPQRPTVAPPSPHMTAGCYRGSLRPPLIAVG